MGQSSPLHLAAERTFLVELARASGDFIRPLFGRHDVAVELKGDLTPVTAADRGAEELLRRMIKARRGLPRRHRTQSP